MAKISNQATIDLHNGFVNLRNVHLTAGSSLSFIAPPATSLTMLNLGRLVSDGSGAVVEFHGGVGPSTTWGGGSDLTVINGNDILAKSGGTVAISANVTQTPAGMIEARTGGVLDISGIVTGGTLRLNGSTLVDTPTALVAGAGGHYANGVIHYDDIQSNVILAGKSDTIRFSSANGKLSEVWDAASHDLTVFEKVVPGHMGGPTGEVQLASLHLVGNYTPHEFSISGDAVLFKAA